MEHVPAHVRSLFWEGLAEQPDPDAHADYIAIRVLEAGEEPAVRWLIDRYGIARLRAIADSGRLRPRQREFWQSVLAA